MNIIMLLMIIICVILLLLFAKYIHQLLFKRTNIINICIISISTATTFTWLCITSLTTHSLVMVLKIMTLRLPITELKFLFFGIHEGSIEIRFLEIDYVLWNSSYYVFYVFIWIKRLFLSIIIILSNKHE